MAEKIYFGIPGLVKEISAPDTGMNYVSNTDVEVTNLVSGGRSIYRAPTAYKTFNMSWKGKASSVKHLIDCYNGQFGSGPFYITDPTITQLNVLPPRWSNAWQLAYQANGWCKPFIQNYTIPTTPDYMDSQTDREVVFTQANAGTAPTSGVLKIRTLRVPGKEYWLAVKGTATGGAAIYVKGYSGGTWTTLATHVNFTGLPVKVVTAAQSSYSFIELDVYMPLGSRLELSGMALSTVAYTQTDTDYMPTGNGIGAVQFDGNADATLVSSVIDRVGLSLDLTEVQKV